LSPVETLKSLERIGTRLKAEASADQGEKLRAATTILLGLRHPPDVVDGLLKGATAMWDDIIDKVIEDSSISQVLIKRGEQRGAVAEARKQLLRFGQAKLGPPDSSTLAALNAIVDLDRLDVLSERLLTVNSWNDLLAP
jgi:hypothetical protein